VNEVVLKLCFDEQGSVQEGKRRRHTPRAATRSSDFKALFGLNQVTFVKGQNATALSCRFCMGKVLKLQIKHSRLSTGSTRQLDYV
jgi:hypothetical protein